MNLFPPTSVGDLVRFASYGGAVPMWMVGERGEVVRFTRPGNPVIRVATPTVRATRGVESIEVTDTYECAHVVDADGKWVRDARSQTMDRQADLRSRLNVERVKDGVHKGEYRVEGRRLGRLLGKWPVADGQTVTWHWTLTDALAHIAEQVESERQNLAAVEYPSGTALDQTTESAG